MACHTNLQLNYITALVKNYVISQKKLEVQQHFLIGLNVVFRQVLLDSNKLLSGLNIYIIEL